MKLCAYCIMEYLNVGSYYGGVDRHDGKGFQYPDGGRLKEDIEQEATFKNVTGQPLPMHAVTVIHGTPVCGLHTADHMMNGKR